MSESIFVEGNPYGYRLNISHPKIAPLYWRYKAWKDIPRTAPMSDQERFEFEAMVLKRKEQHERHTARQEGADHLPGKPERTE